MPKEIFEPDKVKKYIIDNEGNIIASSTRRDDLLLDRQTLDRMWILRKYLADMTPMEAMEFVKDRLEKTKDNGEFLMSMNS